MKTTQAIAICLPILLAATGPTYACDPFVVAATEQDNIYEPQGSGNPDRIVLAVSSSTVQCGVGDAFTQVYLTLEIVQTIATGDINPNITAGGYGSLQKPPVCWIGWEDNNGNWKAGYAGTYVNGNILPFYSVVYECLQADETWFGIETGPCDTNALSCGYPSLYPG